MDFLKLLMMSQKSLLDNYFISSLGQINRLLVLGMHTKQNFEKSIIGLTFFRSYSIFSTLLAFY